MIFLRAKDPSNLTCILQGFRDRNTVSNGAYIFNHNKAKLGRTQLFLIKFFHNWIIWTAAHIHYSFILLLRDNNRFIWFLLRKFKRNIWDKDRYTWKITASEQCNFLVNLLTLTSNNNHNPHISQSKPSVRIWETLSNILNDQ